MKKTVIATVLCGTLSLPVYGSGIYVGDVKFYAKEICSREFTSTFAFNNGCLPLTRASNVQNYFFEDIRLPISHGEANSLDQAAQGNLAVKPTALAQVSVAADALSELLKQVQTAISDTKKSKYDANSDIQAAIAASKDVADKDASKRLIELLNQADGVVASAVVAADDVASKTAVEFNGMKENNPELAKIRQALDNIAQLFVKLQQQINDLNAAASSDNVLETGAAKLQLVKDDLAKLLSGNDIASAANTLNAIKLGAVPDKLKTFETQIGQMDTLISNLDETASALPDSEASKVKVLSTATSSLKKIRDNLQADILPVTLLGASLTQTGHDLDQLNVAIKAQAISVAGEINSIIPGSDALHLKSQLRIAVEEASRLTTTEATSYIHPNLLPSIIGRVFVTDRIVNGEDVRYKVPGHDGNFQFIPLDKKYKVQQIPTEVLVNSNLDGLIRKNRSASGSFSIDQVVAAALKASGIPSPKINLQLKAQISTAISRASMGSGNYYYVSMTDEALDKLTGTILKGYLSAQPIDRDEAHRSNEVSDPGCRVCNADYKTALAELGLGNFDIGQNQGLGVIVGAAILRTRSGHTEVCSSNEIAVYNPTKSPSALGNDGTACAKLRNILITHGVASADIPTALSSLSSGYRQESYKTLQIIDHASVLAIQWVPVSIPKHKTAHPDGSGGR